MATNGSGDATVAAKASKENEPSDSGSDEQYKAPAPKSVQEIMEADKEDESLQRYKAALLGAGADKIIVDAENPKNVLVRGLTLMVDGRPDVTMKLDEKDLDSLEKQTFVIKEGCQYRLRVDFHVQREIVAGLKYVQKVYRHGIQVDKDDLMVGSYGPKESVQSYKTPVDEAPSGMLHRGTYKVKSCFTDDDKHDWLTWNWSLEIKKDWE